MEKRKLLLVAVSVGVFLVIVLSAAILIFTPAGGGSIAALRPVAQAAVSQPTVPPAPPRGPASADVVDIARNPGEIQGLIAPPSVVPALSEAAETPAQRSADGSAVVISVPKPAAPALPLPEGRTPSSGASTTAPARSQGTQAARTTTTPTPATPATVTPAAATPAAVTPARTTTTPVTATPATATPTAATPARTTTTPAAATPARTTTTPVTATPVTATPVTAAPARSAASRPSLDYWIQTGAFSALVRAEDAKESLAAKGLNSIIDNREVNGQIWYRVRVGPYISENEAGYWLALVRAIDGFGESQIRSTQR